VTVRDQGGGIDPQHVPHIFEPFFTTKDVGEGTGLGLPVAHGSVQEHGGWIAVESRFGQGSAFTVFLPREARP
jgi:two-component system NtrC family sensor kinase